MMCTNAIRGARGELDCSLSSQDIIMSGSNLAAFKGVIDCLKMFPVLD
jgi:hypothetical protein